MLKIKLTRTGKKHQPSFRIVIVEDRSKLSGRYLENIGHYNPMTKEIVIDKVSYGSWIKKGAQPTLTVSNLMKKAQ